MSWACPLFVEGRFTAAARTVAAGGEGVEAGLGSRCAGGAAEGEGVDDAARGRGGSIVCGAVLETTVGARGGGEGESLSLPLPAEGFGAGGDGDVDGDGFDAPACLAVGPAAATGAAAGLATAASGRDGGEGESLSLPLPAEGFDAGGDGDVDGNGFDAPAFTTKGLATAAGEATAARMSDGALSSLSLSLS